MPEGLNKQRGHGKVRKVHLYAKLKFEICDLGDPVLLSADYRAYMGSGTASIGCGRFWNLYNILPYYVLVAT